ncbi:MAG: four helix bundle protein [Muribaculaceae bacterium]|nr:four helix bundle protein [Muribaculaceae bacterium]
MKTSDFKKLSVWQLSMDLACEIYKAIRVLPIEERFALSDQMRRAAISIPSNIAEGQRRNSDKEFIHFLSISRGSAAELQTQLILCNRLEYLKEEYIIEIISQLESIDRMLVGLITSINNRFNQ